MESTTEWYRIQLFKFGIITLINVLEYFEFEENYEECYKIISAIKIQEEFLGVALPTEVTKEMIEDIIHIYKKSGLTGDFLVSSSKYYAKLLIKEIENK